MAQPEVHSRGSAGYTPAEATKWIEKERIKTVIAAVSDTYGIMRGKLLSAERFCSMIGHGHGMAMCDVFWVLDLPEGSLIEPSADHNGYFPRRSTGYPDLLVYPDLATLRRVPWLSDTALVIGDPCLPDGDPVPISPRQVLRNAVKQGHAMGYDACLGFELEFYLLREDVVSLMGKRFVNLEPYSPRPYTYSIGRATLDEGFFASLRQAMADFNIPIETSSVETGPGQYELNIPAMNALDAADAAFLFKAGVKQFATQRGLLATFMAKPQTNWPGCSCHLHQSLWQNGKNAFWSADSSDGVSDTMRRYIAGQLETMAPFAALFAPNVNSYKRYRPYSWAATTASWGIDNRTTGLRVVVEGSSGTRVENRMAGGDANPYLIGAASLSGGLYGIRNRLQPPTPYVGDAYMAPPDALPNLPQDLETAIQRFEESPIVTDCFGPDFAGYYRQTKRFELSAFRSAVTDWEVGRYLELL